MLKIILISLGTAIILHLVIQGAMCQRAVTASYYRLAAYQPEARELSYGKMTYVDRGKGEAVLCAHGFFGGYDQAYDMGQAALGSDYRIIAPSRFGYLGSDILNRGTPSDQAAAYVELLDKLGIEKAYIMGGSAGGTAAIRFALDYPERTKGLILFSSAMPLPAKPEKYVGYQGPPAFLFNNYAMYLMSPLFGVAMSMDPSTINMILPINDRKVGAELDASINNPDMARNFDDYPIENLAVSTLIIHAKDDKLASYESMERVLSRFPNYTLASFETGGHMVEGHSDAVKTAVSNFTSKY